MTLALYADTSRISQELKRGKFRIYYNAQDKLIHIESENTYEGEPRFDSIYNKKEVDDIITTGGSFSPTTFSEYQ